MNSSAQSPLVNGATDQSERSGVPYLQLLALSLAPFVAIMTETVPAGLLGAMSRDMGASESALGQYLTLYAMGCLVAAIPIMTATRRLPRRPLLVGSVLMLALTGALTAVVSDVAVGYLVRFVAGMAGGTMWGLVANYARSLVTPRDHGKALAILSMGQPVALALGVPLGAWVGAAIGWRGVFLALGAVSAVLALWIRLAIPPRPGSTDNGPGGQVLWRTLKLPGVITVLLGLLGCVLAHNMVYAYMEPFTRWASTGMSVDVALLLFGISSGVGVIFTAIRIDGNLLQTGCICGCLLYTSPSPRD